MINLGPFSGKDMPEVRMPAQIVDRILEVLAFLLVLSVWILAWVYWGELSSESKNKLLTLCVVDGLLFGMLFWSSYAPIRFFNFPVRPTQRNVVSQYWLATKLTRTLNVIGTALILFVTCGELSSFWSVKANLFSVCIAATGCLMVVSFLVYFLLARRWR